MAQHRCSDPSESSRLHVADLTQVILRTRDAGLGVRQDSSAFRVRETSRLSNKAHVQRRRRTHEFGNLVSGRHVIEPVEEPLPTPQQQRHVRQMHLVDQPGTQILLDRGGAAAKPDVLPARRFVRRSSADSMPSVTKWKTVPPSIVIDSRG
jgi:hypothetical protein